MHSQDNNTSILIYILYRTTSKKNILFCLHSMVFTYIICGLFNSGNFSLFFFFCCQFILKFTTTTIKMEYVKHFAINIGSQNNWFKIAGKTAELWRILSLHLTLNTNGRETKTIRYDKMDKKKSEILSIIFFRIQFIAMRPMSLWKWMDGGFGIVFGVQTKV